MTLRAWRIAAFLAPSRFAWRPHKNVFEDNTPLARGKQRVTAQAADFAARRVAWRLDRDDLVLGLAAWTSEGDRL